MKLRHLVAGLSLCLTAPLVSCPAALADTSVAEQAPGPSNATDDRRIMVMLDLTPDHYRSGSSYGGDYGDAMGQKLRMRLARKIAREHGLSVLENWPMQLIGVDCVIMTINDKRPAEAVVKELTSLPGVAWSQPLNEFQMQGSPQAQAPYNDKLYAAQPASSRWHLAKLHRVATGKGTTIAVIDSRIDSSHPDLAGMISSSNDFVTGRPLAERHGTGVAGIIVARPNNAMGIAGVAPDARIMGLRACWERPMGGSTVCDSLSLAKALNFALEHHADVINLSLSGPRDPLLSRLIAIALARGVTVVAAVDEQHPAASFPAMLDGVVPVADERLSGWSASVYIAPGQDIPTTEPEGKWSLVSGSSYAAAHVSGLAALLRQASGKHGSANSLLGPRGTINACAAVARVSRLNQASCEARN